LAARIVGSAVTPAMLGRLTYAMMSPTGSTLVAPAAGVVERNRRVLRRRGGGGDRGAESFHGSAVQPRRNRHQTSVFEELNTSERGGTFHRRRPNESCCLNEPYVSLHVLRIKRLKNTHAALTASRKRTPLVRRIVPQRWGQL
jgi:hypothetical protein